MEQRQFTAIQSPRAVGATPRPVAAPPRPVAVAFALLVLALEAVLFAALDEWLPRGSVLKAAAGCAFYTHVGVELARLVGFEPPALRDVLARVAGGGAAVAPTRARARSPPRPARARTPPPSPAAAPAAPPLPPAPAPADAAAFRAAVGVEPLVIPYARLPGSARALAPVATVLRWPLRDVAIALACKFTVGPHRTPADALQPPIRGIDELGAGGAAHSGAVGAGAAAASGVRWLRRRVRVGLDEVPPMLRPLIGADAIEVLVESEVHWAGRPDDVDDVDGGGGDLAADGAAAAGADGGRVRPPPPAAAVPVDATALLAVTRNANAHGIGVFQEAAAYTRHPDRPDDWTLYVSRVEMLATTWVGRSVLGLAGTDGAALIATHVALLQARLRELRGEPRP